jgi:hypothetical protein
LIDEREIENVHLSTHTLIHPNASKRGFIQMIKDVLQEYLVHQNRIKESYQEVM